MYEDGELNGEEIFVDGENLDVEAAAAILRPYPELLEQWQAKLYKRWSPGQPPGPSRSPMLYSPTYLRAVVEEYLILRNGGDHMARPAWPWGKARCSVRRVCLSSAGYDA